MGALRFFDHRCAQFLASVGADCAQFIREGVQGCGLLRVAKRDDLIEVGLDRRSIDRFDRQKGSYFDIFARTASSQTFCESEIFSEARWRWRRRQATRLA